MRTGHLPLYQTEWTTRGTKVVQTREAMATQSGGSSKTALAAGALGTGVVRT